LVSSAFEFLQTLDEPIPEEISGSLIHLVRLIDQAQTVDPKSLQYCVDLTRSMEALRANPKITSAVLQHVVICRESFTWFTEMLLKHPTIPVERKGRMVDTPINGKEVGDKEIADFLSKRYGKSVKPDSIAKARKRFSETELKLFKNCLAAEESALELVSQKEKDYEAKNPDPSKRNQDFLWHWLQEEWRSVELIGLIPEKVKNELF